MFTVCIYLYKKRFRGRQKQTMQPVLGQYVRMLKLNCKQAGGEVTHSGRRSMNRTRSQPRARSTCGATRPFRCKNAVSSDTVALQVLGDAERCCDAGGFKSFLAPPLGFLNNIQSSERHHNNSSYLGPPDTGNNTTAIVTSSDASPAPRRAALQPWSSCPALLRPRPAPSLSLTLSG